MERSERAERMDGNTTLQKLREQRHATLSLADQVPEERWSEPALPGGGTLHDTLAHLLGWDEWAVGVTARSGLSPPPTVIDMPVSRRLSHSSPPNASALRTMRSLTVCSELSRSSRPTAWKRW